jgi:hypothetical protein
MPTLDLVTQRPGFSDSDVVALELRRVEAARRSIRDKIADVAEILAENDRDQIAAEIADIERATAALLKGQPALRAGVEPAAPVVETAAASRMRPIWPLISALWISTAIVAVGAVIALATLVG